ncbi:MAG: hypothetical protein H0V23_11005 [Nocardioidaceae bacterium]|nr:hypothetical protein [Nocardioidaceae bacterium]
MGAAWVAVKVAELRRSHLSSEASAAAARLSDQRVIVTRPTNSALFEELGRAVDRAAEARHAAELDERDQARDKAAEG